MKIREKFLKALKLLKNYYKKINSVNLRLSHDEKIKNKITLLSRTKSPLEFFPIFSIKMRVKIFMPPK